MATNSKKKLIRIVGRGKAGYSPGNEFNMAFVSEPGPERKQVTALMTCREYLNRAVWSSVTSIETSHHLPSTDLPVDTKKMRLLIAGGNDEDKERLFNAKAALNVLEEFAGFESTSKITTVKHEHYPNAWLITGPGEWMSQPQLLSFATWVLRTGFKYGPLNVENFDSVEESFRQLCKYTDTNLQNSDLRQFGQIFWEKMYVLLKFHDEIFDGMDLEKSWPKDASSGDFAAQSGFYIFCLYGKNRPAYSKIACKAQDKFEVLCNEHLPRREKNPYFDKNIGLKGLKGLKYNK